MSCAPPSWWFARPWHRHGTARHLLSALLDEAVSEGADNATLEVAAGKASALPLYEQISFREAGRRHRLLQALATMPLSSGAI